MSKKFEIERQFNSFLKLQKIFMTVCTVGENIVKKLKVNTFSSIHMLFFARLILDLSLTDINIKPGLNINNQRSNGT